MTKLFALLATVIWIGIPVWFLVGVGGAMASPVPARAAVYQRDLTREARALWGLNAPVTVFAGQIEQESHWNPRVCSPFACGLTQFTPDTARTLSHKYPDTLGLNDVFNVEWAMRALVRYDYDLFHATPRMATACDDWAVTLSAYNGGLKWVRRDQALAQAHGKDPSRWWGNVELYTARAPKYAKENRGYPRLILLHNQLHYAGWGEPIPCPKAPS